MAEQFVSAWALDHQALYGMLGSQDDKLVARIKKRPSYEDVADLIKEAYGSKIMDYVFDDLLKNRITTQRAYAYRRLVEVLADIYGKRLAPRELTLAGRGWQLLRKAFPVWGQERLSKYWGGNWDFCWPWPHYRHDATIGWPIVFLVPRRTATAIRKDLDKLDAARIEKIGVPKRIPRFGDPEKWPIDELAPEVLRITKAIQKWCAALEEHPDRDLLIFHDGQS